MVGAHSLFGRPDPFFANRNKPHTKNFLESLHRTYGEPVSALPQRDDVLFQRAYEFRQREKQEHTKLKDEHDALQRRYRELTEETAKIHTLVEQLSKASPKDESSAPGPGADSRGDIQPSVPSGAGVDRGGDERVAEHSEAGGARSNRKRTVRVADARQDPGDNGRRGGSQPDEVLGAGNGDVDRPAAEHRPKGPESGGGAGPSADTADPPAGGEEAAE